MGCDCRLFRTLVDYGYLTPQSALLDVGEQCLWGATREDLTAVFGKLGCDIPAADYDRIVEDFVVRSRSPGDPARTSLFLGDVVSRTSVRYVSLDIVTGRRAERFDLNRHALAASARNRFDMVLNFGTTEHVLNQFNSFRVMHEACRPGGYLFSQVPSTGFINHGYFNYNALLFEDLAAANGYEIEGLWFAGPGAKEDVATKNPRWMAHRWRVPVPLNATELAADAHGCVLLNGLFRKVRDTPFLAPNEIRTAAHGGLPGGAFTSSYIDPLSEFGPPVDPRTAFGADGDRVQWRLGSLAHELQTLQLAHADLRTEVGHLRNDIASLARQLDRPPWWWRMLARLKRVFTG